MKHMQSCLCPALMLISNERGKMVNGRIEDHGRWTERKIKGDDKEKSTNDAGCIPGECWKYQAML